MQAAARHQCTYLIHLHEEDFILQNGDPEWLKGTQYIPKKLRNLLELNKLMAHRPWLINKTHIEVGFHTMRPRLQVVVVLARGEV